MHNYTWLVSSHVLVGGIASARSQFAVKKRHQDVRSLFFTVEECRIVSARQTGELATGSPLGRADCRLGWSDTILLVGDHDERALDTRSESPGPIEADTDRRPCGNALLPLWVAVLRVKRCSAVAGVGCGEGGNRASFAGQRHQQRLAPEQPAQRIGGRAAGKAGKREGRSVS